MYTLRDGCEAPVHAKLEDDDRKHPRYPLYRRYRAAMSAQLVRCNSFKNWLAQEEEDED